MTENPTSEVRGPTPEDVALAVFLGTASRVALDDDEAIAVCDLLRQATDAEPPAQSDDPEVRS